MCCQLDWSLMTCFNLSHSVTFKKSEVIMMVWVWSWLCMTSSKLINSLKLLNSVFPLTDEIITVTTSKKCDVNQWVKVYSVCVCTQSYPTLLWPYGLQPGRLLCHGISQARIWSALPFPTAGDLPDPRMALRSLVSPALAGGFFTCATWEARIKYQHGPSRLY